VLEPAGYPARVLTMGKFRRESRSIQRDSLADLLAFVNAFAAIFAIVTIVFFCFPPAIPGTSSIFHVSI
jgi:hypothetical protein